MNDLLRDLADGAEFAVYQHISLTVGGFPTGQQGADFRPRVGFVEQGAMSLAVDALEDSFRRRPQTDDEGVLLETNQIGRVHGQAAAGGDYAAGASGQFPDESVFQFPKGGFAVLGENLRDALAGARFDEFIGVEKVETQLLGHEPADGGLARAHETNQGQIDEIAGGSHANELSGFGPG